MNVEQLNELMQFHANNLKTDDEMQIHDDTIIGGVLEDDDGFGHANSKNVFQAVIGHALKRAKVPFKPWPANWFTLPIKELASKLLILIMLFFSTIASAQLQLHIGAGKTDLRDNAIVIGIKYIQSFDSIWQKNQYMYAGKNSLFVIAPDANIQMGTNDAFSSINVKATGMFMTFKSTTVAGIETANTSKMFNVFPISVGAETNNLFSAINGIAEVGWVPWYQISTLNLPGVIKATKIGVFLQGGYKFSHDSSSIKATGGERDQSQEAPDKAIFRAKGSFGIDTKKLINVNGLKVGILGTADVWYDFINSAVYRKIEGRGRFYINDLQYIDMIYQKGSGAPLFNKGDQYGIGLTVTF